METDRSNRRLVGTFVGEVDGEEVVVPLTVVQTAERSVWCVRGTPILAVLGLGIGACTLLLDAFAGDPITPQPAVENGFEPFNAVRAQLHPR